MQNTVLSTAARPTEGHHANSAYGGSRPDATVRVATGKRTYDVRIGSALLQQSALFAVHGRKAQALVVTNATVGRHYARQLAECLRAQHADVAVIELPDGEAFKTWSSVSQVFDALLARAADRNTVLYALGGGVIGDLTGFAAACYMRGIDFVQVPTTLLAQVDSSVGGKTGINHPAGKNMVGAFHQPRLVACDLETLMTLPQREIAAGLAEVIKYGPIYDMAFFGWIEANLDALVGRDLDALAHAVRRSVEIKAAVVGADERESGLRAILNFGHTFGHAIEAGLGYGTWLHGEGVGCGMVMAARLSERLGLVDAAFVERLASLVKRAGLPTVAPRLDAVDNAGRYLQLMRLDKKAEAGAIRFVLIDGPGRAVLQPVEDDLVRAVIDRSTLA